ncbi:MAG: glycosyltransferase [Acidobacteria bacterium]|nr:glycosyltransferase [Acidobacteriota bacterium]MCA1651456.1 glycosyltransferase [Acidobacteriota bacterium]
MTHVVVMVTTSYPRFPGDSVGTFMEPIAKSLTARGHQVHIVAPWHQLVTRGAQEDGIHFHFYKYAPVPALNVFGYASAMRADVTLRGAAFLAAPLALAAGWRAARAVARTHDATVVHGHWVVPGGITAAVAAPRLPLVVSLHGSDVYVAETLAPARAAARATFARAGVITACSTDLARRAVALGADADRVTVIPYGVDVDRFHPDPSARNGIRSRVGIASAVPMVFAAGRLVRKKGFEYLIDALAQPAAASVVLALAGGGDLEGELRKRAAEVGVAERVRFLGVLTPDDVAAWLAAADVAVVPSVRDDTGNVDGLPNAVLEALASGTPLVTTTAGGIAAIVRDGRTAVVVPERDPGAIAAAIARLLADPDMGRALGSRARDLMQAEFGWGRSAVALEAAYDRALAFKSSRR